MSRSIKVQKPKLSQDSKLETLLNSYTSLKSILSPNLSENNNIFMNSLIDLIISQLKIFQKLLIIKDEMKIFNIVNTNNQELSKQIAFLYELPKCQTNSKISINSSSDKKIFDSDKKYNNKEILSPSKKNESFRINNSENIELLDFNNNKTASKNEEIDITNDNDINNENINNNIDNDSNKKNKIKIKQKNVNDFKDRNDKFIKIKTPEKNELFKSLNFSNKKYSINTEKKEKEKSIKVKRQKVLKKLTTNKDSINEKDSNIQQKRNDISLSYYPKNLNTSKSTKYEFSTYKPKNTNASKKSIINKNKQKSLYKKITKKQTNNDNANNNNIIDIKINIKSERKLIKSKTFENQLMPISNLIETSNLDKEAIDNEKNNKYLSSTHSEKIISKLKTPKISSLKQNNIKNNKKRNKSSSVNISLKSAKNLNKNNNKKSNQSDFFSLDEFLIPQTGKEGEKLFYTKKGKVLINKKQKDILEDYVNNYLFDEDDSKVTSKERKGQLKSNKSVKELINMNSSKNKNKNYIIKGTSTHYNSKDIMEVLELLPNTLNSPIDEYYLKKKRASLFDMGIFKICHNVIDNYKKLEGKGDTYNYKKPNQK